MHIPLLLNKTKILQKTLSFCFTLEDWIPIGTKSSCPLNNPKSLVRTRKTKTVVIIVENHLHRELQAKLI